MAISPEEFKEFQISFPEMRLNTGIKDKQIIVGPLQLNHRYNDFTVNETFDVEINITDEYPFSVPIVRETGDKISRQYSHIYSDGSLCLGIDGEIILKCNGVVNLTYLINTYVIPYFFSYRYYERFHEYPFGERSHGLIGILEAYCETFNVKSFRQAYDILKYAISYEYRGHLPCPCNSGRRIRNCHGQILRKITGNVSIKKALSRDLSIIDRGIEKYEQYSKKTK